MKRLVLFCILVFLTACGQDITSSPSTTTITKSSVRTDNDTYHSPVEATNLLIEATEVNDLALVAQALERGADVETSSYESTPLIIASLNGSTDIVTLLINAGADVNATNSQGFTPLIGAAVNGQADVIAILANTKINLDQRSSTYFGMMALHWAARNGHSEAIGVLLNAGADINVLEDTESSPLIYASFYGHIDVAELLINQGAELNVRDIHGQTALDYAKNRNRTEIAELLAAAG